MPRGQGEPNPGLFQHLTLGLCLGLGARDLESGTLRMESLLHHLLGLQPWPTALASLASVLPHTIRTTVAPAKPQHELMQGARWHQWQLF